jgi:CheY-like chemotaxis protein
MQHDFFDGLAFEELSQRIAGGHVIAFVGAGFSIPASRVTWRGLLLTLAAMDPSMKAVGALLEPAAPSHAAFEAAAQMLQDAWSVELLTSRLDEALRPIDPLPATMRDRLDWLRGIPFEAILTTNFDRLLVGNLATPEAFGELLRSPSGRWFQPRYWAREGHGAPVIKLHGDLAAKDPQLVFTRRDYRRRLYRDPTYAGFLRSVLATRTVLYLGFSFTDAYLNELRSETLAMLGFEPGAAPTAFAVMADVPADLAAYTRDHEGIHIFSYRTADDPTHTGLDRFLEALHARARPTARLGALLARRRLLWVDPQPDNNDFGRSFLLEASGTAGCEIVAVATWRDALARLSAGPPFDLILTHWGEGRATRRSGAPCASAERLLEELTGCEERAPVIVFAGMRDFARRKRRALRAGAVAYAFEWERLFEVIEEVLG